MLALIFWTSIATVVYTFAGYPLLLAVWSRLRPRRWHEERWEPSITVVISAYNEAPLIAGKIANLLSLDYPANRLEILVGSDGSTDGTADRVRSIADERVRVFEFPARNGKPEMLNALIARARGEIIVMSDVRQTFDSSAFRALVQPFADREVGAVSGQITLTTEAGTAVTEGSGLYWRYETFIRSRECLVDSAIAVTGPIYAIRKELFEPIPTDTLVEDMLIPLRIARRGYRVIVNPAAHAIDCAYATAGQEFTRKVRTLAGNFQLFKREPWLLNPVKNRLWLQTLSHKLLRLLIAPLQVAIASLNVALMTASPLYKLTMAAQIIFYSGALAGCLLPRHWRRPVAVSFPFIFCLLSWASVLAFLRSVTGRQPVTWQKAAANAPWR